MKYFFLAEADQELDEAIAYYEKEGPQLAAEFSAAMANAIERILAAPLTWPVIDEEEGEVRRYMTTRFPYGILYEIDGDLIQITAVAHLHRKPRYWAIRGRR